MVSRLFSTAGSLISQVGEVLAPQVHSPLEDLRDHWKAVRKFYIDENENDVEAFQSSQLPEHLVSMVSILVEEEATLGDTGPCVEYFLQQKILETLCLLAERDSPQGVRKLVLQTVAILLGDVSLPLLPHMSVHRPVRNLIRRLTINPQPTRTPSTSTSTPTKSLPQDIPQKDTDTPSAVQPDSEFVTLLETLANKFIKDPSLLGFFTDDLQFEEGDLLVFQGLLKHLWDPGAVGERARRGAATCLLLPQLPPLKSSSPPSDASLPQPADPSAESNNANPNPSPSTAPPTNQTHMMINWEVFIKKQVLELISTFRKLPMLTTLPTSNQSIAYQLLENCKNRVSFCSALAKLPKEDISEFMIHTFEEQFLEGTLGPLLLHPNETDTISTTIYLRELLPCFSSPLLDTLLKFLLGDFVGPEHKEEEEVHLLRYTLITRINSQNEAMSIASCRLFSTLIGLHNPQVINNLILRTIQIPPTSSPSSFRRNPLPSSPSMRQRENTLESLQPSITRFLTLFGSKFTQLAPPLPSASSRSTSSPIPSVSPNPASANSTNDITNKNEDNGDTNFHSSNLSDPSPNIEVGDNGINFGRNSGTYNTIGSGFEVVGGGAGYDSYLVDAQHQLTVCKAACKDWPQSVLNAQVPTQPTPYVGLFLEQIFAKLHKVLDQDLDMNLVVTGIFAKLCYYPVLALSLYLLSYQPFVSPGVPTLYGIVEKVLQEVENRSKKFVNITACIERARGEMADPNPNYDHSYNKIPNTELGFNPKRYLQGVIVLEEFCKELAAILQAKVVFGIGADKKGPGRI